VGKGIPSSLIHEFKSRKSTLAEPLFNVIESIRGRLDHTVEGIREGSQVTARVLSLLSTAMTGRQDRWK
jgi:hypothetical protein